MNTLQILVWGLVTVFLSATTLFAVATCFYVHDWRRTLQREGLILVPDGMDAAVRRAGADSERRIEDLQTTFLSLRTALDQRDREIERLREGYDRGVYRRFLRRFVRVDHALRLGESPSSVSALLDDALDECDVERFGPRVGEEYRTAIGVEDHPEVVETDEQDRWGKIAEVLSDGYRLRADGHHHEVIQPARVRVFGRP